MTPPARRRAWRLVPIAAAAWLCAAGAVLIPAAAVVGAAVLWAGAALLLLLAVRRPHPILVVGSIALVAGAVGTTHVALVQPVRQAVAELAGTGGRAVELEVLITGRVSAGPTGDVWFDGLASRVIAGGSQVVAAVPVRVGVAPDDTPGLARADLGARVRIAGASLPPDPGDRAALVVRARDAEMLDAPPVGWGVLAWLRHDLVASSDGLPGPGAALVPGLAVGDTSRVDAALDEQMKSSSLAHLTAVSGANCALVVGAAFGLAAWAGARRGTRIVVGLVSLIGFVLLVTPEPSVVRAATMAAIALVALALGRLAAGIAVLSLAVALLLVLDPWLAVSLGFGLSVAATGALLVLARPLGAALSRVLPAPLALTIAVPLAAQLACGPLLVLVDPRVPVLGVVANVLAAPAAPVGTVLGLLGCLAAPVPVLQDGLVALSWIPATWIAGVARSVAGIPDLQIPWAEGIAGAAGLAGVSGCVVLLLVRGRARRTTTAIRLGAGAVLALVLAVGSGQLALRTVVSAWTVPDAWRIVMCDVGQGDAVIIRSAGAVAVVDTGPEPETLSRCLERFGVRRVDLLVLTHFDVDHAGGARALVGRVGTVLHGPIDGGRGHALLDALARGGATPVQAATGDTGTLGAARWRVLWPAASVRLPGNDASVVLDVSGDDLPRTLLLGDLSAEPQTRVRASMARVDYDVVKVAHHGSADQDASLYDAANAELALIPVGEGNDYGHPRASLLDTLRSQATAIARADRHGAVAVWREGEVLRVWSERGVPPDR